MTRKKQTNTSTGTNNMITIGIARLSGIKFDKDVPEARRQFILGKLRDLKVQIPEIQLLLIGTSIPAPAPFDPPLDKGFTHGIILGFKTLEDLRIYEAHPALIEFKQLFAGSVLDNSLEADVPVAPGTQINLDALPKVFRFLGFKIKRPAPQGQETREQEIKEKVEELPSKISDLGLFIGGAPVAKNEFDKDFTQEYLEGFDSIEALRAYESNPAHQDFVAFLLAVPMLDDSLVADIQTTE
jgi:hypothetical protein